jgi:short-subunit dehydrogenase
MGVVHGCERFVPRMIERGAGGHVVNVASSAGYAAIPALFAYSATKFAAFGFSEALRIEMGQHKINVITICQGLINTAITRTSAVRGAHADGLLGFTTVAATPQNRSRSTSCAGLPAIAPSPQLHQKHTSCTC